MRQVPFVITLRVTRGRGRILMLNEALRNRFSTETQWISAHRLLSCLHAYLAEIKIPFQSFLGKRIIRRFYVQSLILKFLTWPISIDIVTVTKKMKVVLLPYSFQYPAEKGHDIFYNSIDYNDS